MVLKNYQSCNAKFILFQIDKSSNIVFLYNGVGIIPDINEYIETRIRR